MVSESNAVAPGIIETSKSDLERLNYLKSKIPLLRAGKPEDIAKTITFLASSEADIYQWCSPRS